MWAAIVGWFTAAGSKYLGYALVALAAVAIAGSIASAIWYSGESTGHAKADIGVLQDQVDRGNAQSQAGSSYRSDGTDERLRSGRF